MPEVASSHKAAKVLTVCQPWAWAIMSAGKDVENRSWSTGYRGRLWIHAGGSRRFFTKAAVDEVVRIAGLKVPVPLELGAIIGSVELVDCLHWTKCESPWRNENSWCWILRDPRPLATPSKMLGRQGLWEVELSGATA